MDWSEINVTFVIGVVLTSVNVFNWIYNYFIKAYKIKRGNEEFHETVEKHDIKINKLDEKMTTVMSGIDRLFKINKIQTRHSLTNDCIEALDKGYIEQYKLQSLEDMFAMYEDILHGNSYVNTLMIKVRNLPTKDNED